MIDKSLDLDERFFANHKFEPGIGLAEYELASRKLDGAEKAFLWATNIATIFVPLVWYGGFRLQSDWLSKELDDTLSPILAVTFLVFSAILSLMALFHIIHLLKSKVISARKIILLRRAMGIRYGANSMVLPSWRLEGADNPFSIRMFPGFFAYSSFSVFVVIAFPALSILLLFDQVFTEQVIENSAPIFNPSRSSTIAAIVWITASLLIYRIYLREQYENTWLWLARLASWLLRIPLVGNVEYHMYRCKLEISEAARIRADVKGITPLAIAIEDKSFLNHRGLSWRGIGRAVLQYAKRNRVSGGSTITQQCARTNFLLTLHPAWKRKVVEIILAKWLESVLTKEEILRIYLTTARFDFRVYGFHRANYHFFNTNSENLSKANAFILIERLGNMHKRFLGDRVKELLGRLVKEGVLDNATVLEILGNYKTLLVQGRLETVSGASLDEISAHFEKNVN